MPARWQSPRGAVRWLLRLLPLLSLCAGLLLGCRGRSAPVVTVAGGGALAPLAGNGRIDDEIRSLQQALSGPSAGDAETWARLAQALLRKARQSSDDGLYPLADDAAQRALRITPDQPDAQHARLAVLLHGHRFAEAQAQATSILQRSPRDATAWGALGDSALERGDLTAAQHAIQAMIDLRPDLRSYSRGAWLRYLLGDADGAIDLMQQAIEAGSPRSPEPRAFCRVGRAELLFLRGRYTDAQAELDRALLELPGYAPARAARGRLLLHALDDAAAALPELYAALDRDPQLATRISLHDAHEAMGNAQAAAEQHRQILAEGPRLDPRTLALFLASRREQPERAIALARAEIETRPDLWSQDALAWALYHGGHLGEAWLAMQRAVASGIVDPRLDYHLGVIAQARGDLATAGSALKRALGQSPRWDRRESAQARTLLERIAAPHLPAPR